MGCISFRNALHFIFDWDAFQSRMTCISFLTGMHFNHEWHAFHSWLGCISITNDMHFILEKTAFHSSMGCISFLTWMHFNEWHAWMTCISYLNRLHFIQIFEITWSLSSLCQQVCHQSVTILVANNKMVKLFQSPNNKTSNIIFIWSESFQMKFSKFQDSRLCPKFWKKFFFNHFSEMKLFRCPNKSEKKECAKEFKKDELMQHLRNILQ